MRRHRSWYVATLAAGAALVLLGAKCSLFNKAPAVPAVTGPAQGVAGVPVTFRATATDPDGDSIAFQFDWGDTTTPAWSAFLASGEALSATHTYADSGNYTVKARAKDRGGKESEWGAEQALQLVGAGPGYPDSVIREIWSPWSVFSSGLSPDGSLLCLGPSRDAESLIVLRTADLVELPRLRVGSKIGSIVVAADGDHVYIGGYDSGTVKRLSLARGQVERSALLGATPRDLVVSPDGLRLYVGEPARVRVMSADSLAAVDSVVLPSTLVQLRLSSDGSMLYVCMSGGLGIVAAATCSLVTYQTSVIPDRMVLSADEQSLFVTSEADSGVVILRASDLAVLRRENLHTTSLGHVGASPDGIYLYTCTADGLCYLDTRTLSLLGCLAVPASVDLLVHPDGDVIYHVTTGIVRVIARR